MWHSLTVNDVINKLNSSVNGLSDEEASKRLKEYGYNSISNIKNNIKDKIIDYLENPFLLLFIFADILSIIFEGRLESVFISIFLLIYILSDITNDNKSDKIIKSLEKDLEKKVLVIRNKKKKYINSSELVPGDIILLKYGDKVPADIRIIKSFNLEVDESSITGESNPVIKKENVLPLNIPIKERKNMLYYGTYILKGECIGIVVETGLRTYYGSIYKELLKEDNNKTLLEEELNKFSKYIIIFISIIIVILFLLIYIKHTLSLYNLIIFIIALSIVIIPEGLPAALVLIYSISTNKLEKKKIFIKNPSLLEDLGNIDTVVLDKTGTLTYNKLKIEKILYNGRIYNRKSNRRDLKKFLNILYNSLEDLNIGNNIEDPIESEIYNFCKYKNAYKDLNKISINYFDPYRKRTSVIVKINNNKYSIVKGSFDSILNISRYIIYNGKRYDIELFKDKLKRIVEKYSRRGYRVIAIGYKKLLDNNPEKDITFLGILLFKERIRKGLNRYINFLKDLNIDIYIITGDNKFYTENIIKKINIKYNIFDSNNIKNINDEELKNILNNYNVFVNADPEDKYRIVRILKNNNKRVLFLGDGINDSIALKSANIGITFYNASDIAKDSAGIIIMENGLEPIIDLIKEGKRVIYNLKVYLIVLLSELMGSFLFILLGFLIYNDIFLESLQLLILNLVIETINSISISAGSIKDYNIIKNQKLSIFNKNTILEISRNSIFVGLSAIILALATYDNEYIIILFLIISQSILYLHYENVYKIDISKHKEYYISIFLGSFIVSIFLLPYLRNIVLFIIPSIIDIFIFTILSVYLYIIYRIIEKAEGIRGV
ncbi:copper-exporting P-type ATPase B [Nanobdella aerobiophila]|uniref:Copper-exporting P-type ATPase B n=1 Tax=Nanobdella aerobiophila TaxID=2586965 RepID=A0A915SFX8_9ARCH|nr:HAD-IC family P-type ATPase [Nanobdella aerobiophila]BBL45704.1 copper-exporting P-type ATPase B [Nanobdella aerobiophila]